MQRLALALLLITVVPAFAFAAGGNTYFGRIDFSGTSTAATTLYIQLRDGSGITQCATSDPINLPLGTTAIAARDSVAMGWRIIEDFDCWDGTTAGCRLSGINGLPSIIIETEGAGFTVFASTDGSTWSQVTSVSSFSFGSGLQIGVGADTGSNVPTLTEWGLILLAALLGFTGFTALRRRSAPVGA